MNHYSTPKVCKPKKDFQGHPGEISLIAQNDDLIVMLGKQFFENNPRESLTPKTQKLSKSIQSGIVSC